MQPVLVLIALSISVQAFHRLPNALDVRLFTRASPAPSGHTPKEQALPAQVHQSTDAQKSVETQPVENPHPPPKTDKPAETQSTAGPKLAANPGQSTKIQHEPKVTVAKAQQPLKVDEHWIELKPLSRAESHETQPNSKTPNQPALQPPHAPKQNARTQTHIDDFFKRTAQSNRNDAVVPSELDSDGFLIILIPGDSKDSKDSYVMVKGKNQLPSQDNAHIPRIDLKSCGKDQRTLIQKLRHMAADTPEGIVRLADTSGTIASLLGGCTAAGAALGPLAFASAGFFTLAATVDAARSLGEGAGSWFEALDNSKMATKTRNLFRWKRDIIPSVDLEDSFLGLVDGSPMESDYDWKYESEDEDEDKER